MYVVTLRVSPRCSHLEATTAPIRGKPSTLSQTLILLESFYDELIVSALETNALLEQLSGHELVL